MQSKLSKNPRWSNWHIFSICVTIADRTISGWSCVAFVILNSRFASYPSLPSPYLKAIDLSGIKNNNSLVFEDSNAGIKSALTANLPTIFIPSNIPTTLDENIEIECIVDTLGDEKKMSNVIKGPKLETNYIDHAFLNNYLKLFFHAKH